VSGVSSRNPAVKTGESSAEGGEGGGENRSNDERNSRVVDLPAVDQGGRESGEEKKEKGKRLGEQYHSCVYEEKSTVPDARRARVCKADEGKKRKRLVGAQYLIRSAVLRLLATRGGGQECGSQKKRRKRKGSKKKPINHPGREDTFTERKNCV